MEYCFFSGADSLMMLQSSGFNLKIFKKIILNFMAVKFLLILRKHILKILTGQGAFVKIQSIKGILLAIHKNFVPQIFEAVQ